MFVNFSQTLNCIYFEQVRKYDTDKNRKNKQLLIEKHIQTGDDQSRHCFEESQIMTSNAA